MRPTSGKRKRGITDAHHDINYHKSELIMLGNSETKQACWQM